MERFRELFPVTAEWAYLNHCAVSPLATPVVAAMQRFMDDQQHHGVMHYMEWQKEVKEVREKAASLINASIDEVAFVRNTVEGISMVAEGLPWQEGDNVVTVYGEYPANVYPWLNLKSRGVETRVVPDRAGRVVLEDVFGAVDERTRLITLSFVEFTNGFRNDLAAVGEFCRRRGILFMVDAIQGLGALPLDVEGVQIDFMAAGAHKWLLGPLGIGILYCRLERLDQLRLIQVGPASMPPRPEYLPYDFELRADARRFEAGAQNIAGIYGLGAILDVLQEAGIANIEQHLWGLLDFAVAELKAKGCEVLSSLAPGERSGMIAFRSPRMATPDLMGRLGQAKVAITARSGGIRIAPHLYNNQEDIERLLAEVPGGGAKQG
jgi:selenocysteine lyase/cysteine desulfurase